MKLKPIDSLWLSILESDAELKKARTAAEARRLLKKGKFPAHLVEAYLAQRFGSRSIKASA